MRALRRTLASFNAWGRSDRSAALRAFGPGIAAAVIAIAIPAATSAATPTAKTVAALLIAVAFTAGLGMSTLSAGLAALTVARAAIFSLETAAPAAAAVATPVLAEFG